MLIRWATKHDIPLWESLSKEYDQFISEIATDLGKWYQGFNDFMSREHFFHFEDMPEPEMTDFMLEVQRVGKALRKVTGAEKINYEMHANSGAHLHIHLFPRYLDDDFPSAPIDYRISEPAPYESYEEYLWFIEQMRKELTQ